LIESRRGKGEKRRGEVEIVGKWCGVNVSSAEGK
jgi:hypothetical protein